MSRRSWDFRHRYKGTSNVLVISNWLDVEALAGELLAPVNVFAFLARHRGRLFPDSMMENRFPSRRGRPSVPERADRFTRPGFGAGDRVGAGVAGIAGRTWNRAEDSDGTDGRWRIARKVPPDRLISTIDPDTRHAHKTQSRQQDGFKAHIVIEPDTGLITTAEN